MSMTKAPFGAHGIVLPEDCVSRLKQSEQPNKIDRILKLFSLGLSLNRFEAERYGDHCLNSTVAVLRNRYRVNIESEWEEVPNRFGCMTRVKRYRLAADELMGASNE